jgi:hypothetical protein
MLNMNLFGFGKTPEARPDIEDLSDKPSSGDLKIFKEIKKGNLDNVDKLTVIDKDTAEILSKNKGSLALNSVTFLSGPVAEVLFNHEGDIKLNGLASLSNVVLENLFKNKGALSFNGVTSIDDAGARYLSIHEGYLSLDGLTALSESVAEILSKHKGSLSLKGLIARVDGTGASLSQAAAKSLYNLKGNLDVSSNVRLQINTAGYIQEIGEGNFEHVGQLRTIPNGEVADIFSKYVGTLSLDSLVQLSPSDCVALSTHKGDLYLPNLKFVPEGGEMALAKHEGTIFAMPSVRAVIESAKRSR